MCAWEGLSVRVFCARWCLGADKRLTENSSRWNRLPIEPEGDLRENDRHDAWQVCLDHKITNFSFQVEIRCHDNILSWKRTAGETLIRTS